MAGVHRDKRKKSATETMRLYRTEILPLVFDGHRLRRQLFTSPPTLPPFPTGGRAFNMPLTQILSTRDPTWQGPRSLCPLRSWTGRSNTPTEPKRRCPRYVFLITPVCFDLTGLLEKAAFSKHRSSADISSTLCARRPRLGILGVRVSARQQERERGGGHALLLMTTL